MSKLTALVKLQPENDYFLKIGQWKKKKKNNNKRPLLSHIIK
jgi:hypothetical protein